MGYDAPNGRRQRKPVIRSDGLDVLQQLRAQADPNHTATPVIIVPLRHRTPRYRFCSY
jgi:hypothetical protein